MLCSQSQSGLLTETHHLLGTLTNTVVKIKILLTESLKIDKVNWRAKKPALVIRVKILRATDVFLRNWKSPNVPSYRSCEAARARALITDVLKAKLAGHVQVCFLSRKALIEMYLRRGVK